ncbi:MAG: hypothetical protein K6G42_11515 [Lachnospiraceae bacterium]|nr:hypothetical protein [Lachnospiraceae bacterium]
MGLITEEMAREYHRCNLYKEYIEQLQISEKNNDDEFMQSLRCSNIYVPDPKEVTEKYRKQAAEQGIDEAWIEKFMPIG